MKTEVYSFLFTGEEVGRFIELSGEENAIYRSLETALARGYKGIPLPPTMPMMVYRRIQIPWKLGDPVIHRKQECRLHQVMYIDQLYTGFITLTNHTSRHNKNFVQQDLEIYDEKGSLCFTGTSHLIAGGIIEDY